MKCRLEQHRALHALIDDFSRAFPGVRASQFKDELITQFPRFKAQAEGRAIPPRLPRESTLAIPPARMAELIEFCAWMAAELGVAFSHGE